LIGKAISHYKITEKLGEGGMGEVYLADDLKLERQVAIKFLPEHLTKDNENVERFEREAKAAAALNHPNIVTIHDVLEEDDGLCIVMEYVDGKSLREVINEYKLGLDKIIDIIRQLSEGLSKAHKAGIVHRDIKPENIIIDQDARVKILDFGLAKLKGVSKLTKETSTLGTIHYMSPEQTRGSQVDQRSDIWSLGVVLYEMLMGNVPFKADYDQAVLYAIQNEEPEPVDTITTDLNGVIKKALAKDPDERYQRLEDFIDDFKIVGSGVDEKSKSKLNRYVKYSVILIAIVIVGYFLKPYIEFGNTKTSSLKTENTVAVLPFEVISIAEEDRILSDGFHDDIITQLVKVRSKIGYTIQRFK
jgi:serine/threonine protein kinase